jgi:hypothetical protein
VTFTPYATATDLDDWLDTAAGQRGDAAPVGDVPRRAGLPAQPVQRCTDRHDAEVLTAATCAQAASWIALGIDPASLGIDPTARR